MDYLDLEIILKNFVKEPKDLSFYILYDRLQNFVKDMVISEKLFSNISVDALKVVDSENLPSYILNVFSCKIYKALEMEAVYLAEMNISFVHKRTPDKLFGLRQ